MNKTRDVAVQILKTPGWFTADAVALRGHNRGTTQTVLSRMERMGAVRRRGRRGATQYYVVPEWARGHRDPAAVVFEQMQKVCDARRREPDRIVEANPWLGGTVAGQILAVAHAHERRGVNPAAVAQKLGVTLERVRAELGRLASLGLVRQTSKGLFGRTTVALAQTREILEKWPSPPPTESATAIKWSVEGAEKALDGQVERVLEAAKARQYDALCRRLGQDPEQGLADAVRAVLRGGA